MNHIIINWFLYTFISVCVAGFSIEDVGEPLFLTPYIENGKILEAKEKARVQHTEMRNVESYSGYLTIDKVYNSNTFFWYFSSQGDPRNDPLLIWMNGGPGASSLLGLFVENGPFIVTKNLTLKTRKYSWTKNHNVIYIDNPIGSGFSFTENKLGYARNQTKIGSDVLSALLQFFKLFPELQKNDFYVTGESYAGKYVPAVSHAIKMHNKNTRANDKINLKGMAIGNGITDPINQMDRSAFLYQIGLFDANERDVMSKIEEDIRTLIRQKEYVKAIRLYNSLLVGTYPIGSSLLKNVTDFDYHYNFLETQKPNNVKHYSKWVKTPDARRALHVGNRDFGKTKNEVYDALISDLIQSVVHFVEDLLEDHRVLIFNGQLDITVPYVITENYIRKMNWPGSKEYQNAVKKVWRVDGEIAGYAKSVRNLNVVLVRNAGHYAPTDQPQWAWDLITRFTRKMEF